MKYCAAFLLTALLSTGCGQKGKLFYPDEAAEQTTDKTAQEAPAQETNPNETNTLND